MADMTDGFGIGEAGGTETGDQHECPLVGVMIDEPEGLFCLRVGDEEGPDFVPILMSAEGDLDSWDDNAISVVEFEGRSYQAACWVDAGGEYAVAVSCDNEPLSAERVYLEFVEMAKEGDEEGEEEEGGEEGDEEEEGEEEEGDEEWLEEEEEGEEGDEEWLEEEEEGEEGDEEWLEEEEEEEGEEGGEGGGVGTGAGR